ncbi:MAG TPA: hypothetical protein PKV13_11440 [Propionicimonas sp.]|nr:hypothetical protein [Propionicimonas sp.]
MTSVRKFLAVAAVTGVFAVLPFATSSIQSAGPVVGGGTSTTTSGGQGGWPLKR